MGNSDCDYTIFLEAQLVLGFFSFLNEHQSYCHNMDKESANVDMLFGLHWL